MTGERAGIAGLLTGRVPVAEIELVTTRLIALLDTIDASVVNVTAIRGRQAAIERHIAEVLAGLNEIDAAPPGSIIDVGSGNGIPGLVLGAARSNRDLHLIESVGRKATLIEQAANAMGLTAQIHSDRAEVVANGPLRESSACVVARALAPPPVALELCSPLVAVGGRIVLWSRAECDAALSDVAAQLGLIALASNPGFLVFAKASSVAERFPRRTGVAGKRPLRPRM